MYQIDWYGNDGRCNPDPDTMETATCGICSTQMSVERNVFGATSSVEAMAGRSHRYDRFTCPHVKEIWHKRIYRLKTEVYDAEIKDADNKDEIKEVATKEILILLGANAA